MKIWIMSGKLSARAHTNKRTLPRTRTHAHTAPLSHQTTQPPTYLHTISPPAIYTQTHASSLAHTHTNHTHTWTHTHARRHTRTCTHMQLHARTDSCMCRLAIEIHIAKAPAFTQPIAEAVALSECPFCFQDTRPEQLGVCVCLFVCFCVSECVYA